MPETVTIQISDGQTFTATPDSERWIMLPSGAKPAEPWWSECQAQFGPMTYVVEHHKAFFFARPAPGVSAIDAPNGGIDHGSFGAAQEACEAHLQAILDAAAAKERI